MKIQFLGCGDAFGSGGRFNTCFMVDTADTRFLIDCGATSLVAMNRFGVDPDSVDYILLTHLHGDHYGGVPFVLVHAHSFSKRERPLLIAGPRTTERRVMEALESLYPGSSKNEWRFNLEFQEFELEKEWHSGPVSVVPYQASHTAGEGPALVLRINVDGKTVTYSGDGGWSDGLAAAAKGADLFIADCYYYDKKTPYHMNLETLIEHLGDIAPERLILTHMSEDMLKRAESLNYETAEDGKIVEI